jgi:hypothetical protein
MGAVSWHLVEKHALRFKPSRRVASRERAIAETPVPLPLSVPEVPKA